MVQQLPTRLGKTPLMDAIFEMRLASSVPLSQIMSGILFSQLGCTNIEKLPHADLPEFIRNSEPNLKYIALSRIDWDGYAIHVGDNSIGLTCGHPYRGWREFLPRIKLLLEKLQDLPFITSIERYSLKYIDVFPFPDFSLTSENFNINIGVASKQLNFNSTHLRTDLNDEDVIHIIQVFGEATGTNEKLGETKHGVLMDIDSIIDCEGLSLQLLMPKLEEKLNTLHTKHKNLFFSLLTPIGLEKLEPHYE